MPTLDYIGIAIMKKVDFEQAVREKLKKIPLESRKQWNNTDLLIWWTEARAEDSYLTWEGCRGDAWQWVPEICRGMIGKSCI